jgi:integrase
MLLVGTGLRWGEAVGLRVGRVDLLAKTPKVLVVEHLHELSSTGEIVFTDPKSRMSRRTVSITAQVALELVGLVAGKQSNELMFTAPKGGPVRTRNFRRIWVKARDAAGLPGLRVHDLRHTHAAILIAANRQMSAISRRLGHSSIAVTDTLYGHLREEIDEGILSAISDAMAQVDPADLAAEVDAELADLT